MSAILGRNGEPIILNITFSFYTLDTGTRQSLLMLENDEPLPGFIDAVARTVAQRRGGGDAKHYSILNNITAAFDTAYCFNSFSDTHAGI